MTDSRQPNWQPISFLPTLDQLMEEALANTAEQHTTFSAPAANRMYLMMK